MASSLQQLLEEEAPQQGKRSKSKLKTAKNEQMTPARDEISLPIYICRDRSSSDLHSHRSRRNSIGGNTDISTERLDSRRHRRRASESEPELAIDGVVAKAVVSILGGYIGRYLRDKSFRSIIRDKCSSCLSSRKGYDLDGDSGILENINGVIERIEKFVEDAETSRKTLKKCSVRLLNVVAFLNSSKTVNGMTCGIPNSYLRACSQLYLSVVYKVEKDERLSASHLLQVFVDSPTIARTHLLPDLWEHLFLPHLLHIKVWYSTEVEFHSSFEFEPNNSTGKEKRLKGLRKVYNYQMDVGTAKFALYYKQWFKVRVEAPPVPEVPLPSTVRLNSRRHSSDSYTRKSSVNRNLYQTVFGTKHERGQSVDFELRNRVSSCKWDLEDEKKNRTSGRPSSQNVRYTRDGLSSETQKSNYFPLFPCQSVPMECSASGNIVLRRSTVKDEENGAVLSDDLTKAISTICSSGVLSECEAAIHLIAKARLSSNGKPTGIEASISKSPVVEGMLEVLFASDDDAVLELALSLLAEIVVKKEMMGHVILNSDPQLEIFLRLLRRTSIFLKAAVLLYLLKPRAKQMISTEWLPLILRVLEFGDQSQTLFTVRCIPRLAALYLLEQLLLGFHEDKNMENAREVISLGGLAMLIKMIEVGDSHERSSAALTTLCCVQADGSCRNYIAENLNKSSLIELLVLDCRNSSPGALGLMTELICLGQRRQITEFMNELRSGWGGLNTMHILLVYLMKTSPTRRPLVAAILFQLDLMGDLARCSIFREESLEAITEGLDCTLCNGKVQEKSAKALMMLAGWFSHDGEAVAERWLLQQSGFQENVDGAFSGKELVLSSGKNWDVDEEETKSWLRKAATALLKNRNKRFLIALSDSIANGIPVLARASLVTLAWLSSFLYLVEDEDLRSMLCSLFIPQMLRSIDYDNALEERVLASLSLLNLSKSSGGSDLIPSLNQESMSQLRNLSLVTWTADELISIIAASLNHQKDSIPEKKVNSIWH